MLDYRFDCFDVDGQLVTVEHFEAHDDLAAFKAARAYPSMHSLEVWQGARRVVVLNRQDDGGSKDADSLPGGMTHSL